VIETAIVWLAITRAAAGKMYRRGAERVFRIGQDIINAN
jgi:hypothetical protein